MRWHKKSQTNPFPAPAAAPAPQWGPKPSVPDEERIQAMPEWERNQIVSEILRMLGTATTEHLAALRDKMANPAFLQSLAPRPSTPMAQPTTPATRPAPGRTPATGPFDRTTRKIDDLSEKMRSMPVPPAKTPVGTTPFTTRERATMGRPPGMERFVKQRPGQA